MAEESDRYQVIWHPAGERLHTAVLPDLRPLWDALSDVERPVTLPDGQSCRLQEVQAIARLDGRTGEPVAAWLVRTHGLDGEDWTEATWRMAWTEVWADLSTIISRKDPRLLAALRQLDQLEAAWRRRHVLAWLIEVTKLRMLLVPEPV